MLDDFEVEGVDEGVGEEGVEEECVDVEEESIDYDGVDDFEGFNDGDEEGFGD